MVVNFVLVSDRRRGIGHQVFTVPSLGKGDDVTNAVRLAHDGDKPIKAESDASVRGAAAGQRVEQMTEVGCVLAEDIAKDVQLKLGIVDSNRPAADFEPVEHEVVVKATDFERVGIHEVDIVGVRLRERMMGGLEAGGTLTLGRQKQREVFNP